MRASTVPADFQHGEGGLLGEALALRASRLDARLPALQRHTELLPLPISSHHVHRSKPPFGTPGGEQPRPRRLSASPTRLLVPLQDTPATPVLTATGSHKNDVLFLEFFKNFKKAGAHFMFGVQQRAIHVGHHHFDLR